MKLKLIASLAVAVVTGLAVVAAFAAPGDGGPSGAQEETPTTTETSPAETPTETATSTPTATPTATPTTTPTATPTATPDPTAEGPSDSVDVCHKPPGDPDNAHTISIGESALEAHLAHGDDAETCTSNGTPESPEGVGLVDVCHIPPDNLDNAHTISISESALEAHLAHGDDEGECP